MNGIGVAIVLALVLVLSACESRTFEGAGATKRGRAVSRFPRQSAPAAQERPLVPSPSASAAREGPSSPRFGASISPIVPRSRSRIRYSWRPGCPVPPRHLRLLEVTYWGFDGSSHLGEVVVHEHWADAMVGVFHKLYRARFPIERLVLADDYQAKQRLLLAHNVSSAFNCRFVTGRRGIWSEHAYGAAIDINPRQNPYVSGDAVLPEGGRRYLNRSRRLPGMIHRSDVVVRAFAEIGWAWGGDWHSLKDYQHFSATGR